MAQTLAMAFSIYATDNASPTFDKVGSSATKAGTALKNAGTAAGTMSRQLQDAANKASGSGARIGDGLVKGIAKAAGSQLLKSAGTAIGNKIVTESAKALGQTSLFQKLKANATRAGVEAGQKMANGLEKPASDIPWKRVLVGAGLAAGALAAGSLAGRIFGREAGSSASGAFKPSFSNGGLLSSLKLGAVGAAAGIAAGAVGALTAALKLGGDRLVAIDDATAKLRGLGHSAKDVTAIMGSALAAVKGTAFGLGDAATIAASSVAAGIKPGKDLERTLRDVADAATIGGSSLTDMGGIFNKVATSNKVYNDTLNQLGDQGIPIVQLLAKQMHVSAAAVTDLASKGKIDFQTFRSAMEAGLGGSALSSGNTFTGALANAKAALGRFGADLLKGAFPQLKRVFGDVTLALDSAAPAATRLGAKIGHVLSDIITNVEGVAPVVGQLGPLFEGAGRIVGALFAPAAGAGVRAYTRNLTSLIDFVATHQADVVKGLQSGANAALDLGQALVDAASAGLRGVGNLADGVAGFVQSGTAAIGSLVHGAADIATLMGPAGIPIINAAKNFDKTQASADGVADGLRNAGKGARSLASGIESSLTPSLKKTRDHVNEVANQEIFKAKQRDAAAKLAVAVRDIGTNADGSQVHLKKFSDISKLSASAQKGLRDRIKDAQGALKDQLGAMQSAGAGQKSLTKAWQTGRDRLADEFQQMGLSKKAAQDLAEKYAGIKPKVNTKFTTPGLPSAVSNANTLKNTLNSIPKNVQIKINQSVATKGDHLLKNSDKNVGNTGGVWTGSRIVKAATGTVLPGWSPGADIHKFYSATAGELHLAGGESIMVPQFTRAMGGAAGIGRLNRAAEAGTLGRTGVARFSSGGSWMPPKTIQPQQILKVQQAAPPTVVSRGPLVHVERMESGIDLDAAMRRAEFLERAGSFG